MKVCSVRDSTWTNPRSLADRKALMKLSLEERRRIMAKQAEELAEHYNSDNTWREAEGGDIIE